ncbi:MFS transporter-like protein [Halenospora varia]|nr:MFS transporter-like protein [Halenospora varia]
MLLDCLKISPQGRCQPFALGFRSSKTFTYWTIYVAIFTDTFLYSLIVPVIPFALAERAAVPAQDTQYHVSLLLAAFGGAQMLGSPVFGWLADRFESRRGPLLLGILSLAISTSMLCLAHRFWIFVLGRICQGISASITWSVGLALLVDTAGKEQVGETMGYVCISLTLGMFLSPVLGGIVYEKAGYMAVMGLAFGLLALDIVLRLIMIEPKHAEKLWRHSTNRDDSSSHQSAKEKTSATEYGESNEDLSRIPDTQVQNNTPSFFTLLRSRRLIAALWGTMIQSLLLTSFDAILPPFVEKTFGWTSSSAGLIFLPLAVPSLLGPVVGWASDKYGPRWFVTAGFILAVPTFILLRLVFYDSFSQKTILCCLLFGIGIAITLPDAPLMAEIMHIVDEKENETPGIFGLKGAFGQAYGLYMIAFAGGALAGPLLAGFLASEAGWKTATMSLAMVSGVTCIPSLAWIGGSKWEIRSHRGGNANVDKV